MAKTNNAKKKQGQDIPLENIPERESKKFYTDEFKRAAADRVIKGESAEKVARELEIPSSSVIAKWVHKVRNGEPLNTRGGDRKSAVRPSEDNVAAVLRNSLERATRARDERLEAAACIVESDASGSEAVTLAKKIRSFKRAD